MVISMGIEYYAFALFVAALICLIAVLFKLLFANVRRQQKLLDEKESKLLQLYQTVESIMEEFNDQIRAAMDDIKEYENRAAAHVASLAKAAKTVKNEEREQPAPEEKPVRAMTVDSTRIRAASEVLERAERMIKSSPEKKQPPQTGNGSAEVIHRLFDETSGEIPQAQEENQTKNARRESILALAREGKTHAQIARELGITQNEVKLVIGLNGAVARSE